MVILIKTQQGSFVNLDNIVAVFADEEGVVIEKNNRYLDDETEVVIFEGTKDQVQEWMEKFEVAVVNATFGVNIINIEV